MGFLDDIRKRLFGTGAKPTLGEIDRALADGRRASGFTPSPSPPVAPRKSFLTSSPRVDPSAPKPEAISGAGRPSSRRSSASTREAGDGIEELPEYRRLLQAVEDPGSDVVLVFGRAGTGKSTAIHWLMGRIGARAALVAPTGIAALNIGGQTIHSFFGLPSGWLKREDIKPPSGRSSAVLKSLRYLIIDECSMVNANLMDSIAQSLEMNGPSRGKLLGGVKVILVGDLLQLPPVVTEDTRPLYSAAGYATEYFFSATCLQSVKWSVIEFTQVMRQSDAQFIERLGDIRLGRSLESAVEWVNKNSLSHEPAPPSVTLVTNNQLADQRNETELTRIQGAERRYDATVEGSWKVEPAPKALRVKVGAQIMMLKNDSAQRWVNGSLGTIERIEDDEIYVTLRNGSQAECVAREEWEQYEHLVDHATGIVTRRLVGRFVQFPLKPAWAITIHKSQGQTYDACSIDFGQKAFSTGQVYVALSRCRSIENLHLVRPLRPQDVSVDPRVREFCSLISGSLVQEAVARASPCVDVSGAVESAPARPMVFLSHASADRRHAEFVCATLKGAGFEFWYSPESVEARPPGFVESIVEGLEGSRALVVLLSEDAQQSEWVKREIHAAIQLKRPILPIWTSSQRGTLTKEFEFLLGPIQDATLGPAAVHEIPKRLRELLA